MEDYKVDFVVDSGMHSRTINLPLKPFTLIGATTRAGLLSPPLRTRFGINHHLEFWSAGGPAAPRCSMSAEMLKLAYDEPALARMAGRARGTPRIANRLLRRCRDYAQVKGDGRLTVEAVDAALKLEGIDELGLDDLDRQLPPRSSSTSTRAGRSASRPSPPRWARRPTRWWTWWSPSCSRSACWPAPAAGPWRPSRPTSTWASPTRPGRTRPGSSTTRAKPDRWA